MIYINYLVFNAPILKFGNLSWINFIISDQLIFNGIDVDG
jgi:hypothetical protein